MIGKTINNYVIERKLGEGGMGNVYFARHNRVDRMVAIKVLHQDLFTNESIRSRFKNEANALIKLGHPNIVKIYDYVEQDNFACLVMEYIEGYTLDDYITKVSGPLITEKAIPVICSVLDAVQYAHDNNIFHRDIKPGNIMVSKDGAKVRIMDFGIAKIIDAENFKATKANTQLGTPFYMSPEHVKGLAYTAASDIYSLGVTLYEIVTGKCPYHAITNLFELQNKIVNEPLPPTAIFYPDVPAHLQDAITKATQKDPSKRFRSCAAFKDFLLSETKPKSESPPSQAVKKNTKSPPAQPVKAVVENKSEPARQPAAQTVEVNKISAPNLLAAYPEKERKSKAWIFILAIFIVMIFAGFFYYEKKSIKDRDDDGIVNTPKTDPRPITAPIDTPKTNSKTVTASIQTPETEAQTESVTISNVRKVDSQKPKEPITPLFRPLTIADVINNGRNEKIICDGEIFNNSKGQNIEFHLDNPKDQKKMHNIKLSVKITFSNGCEKYFTFYYENNTGNGFEYINKF